MGPGKQSFEYFRNFSITFNVQNKVLTTLPLPVQFNQLTTVTLRYATWARAYHGPPICVRGFRGRRQKEERERERELANDIVVNESELLCTSLNKFN